MKKLPYSLLFSILVLLVNAIQAQQTDRIFTNPFDGYSTYLDRQLDSRMDEMFDPGIGVSIIKEGQVRIRNIKGVNELSKESQLLTASTSFYLASVTKPMTSQIIQKLTETGKLDLHSPINTILNELPEYMKNVTVEDLINHKSGIKNFYEYITWREPLIDNNYVLSLLKDKTDSLEFTPGTRHSYSNSNYVLLAEIIEQVSGKTYFEMLESVVLKPARMRESSLNAPLSGLNKAVGYNFKDDQFLLNDYERIEFAGGFIGKFNKKTYGSSGVFSTQPDLERWILQLNEMNYFDKLPSEKLPVEGYQESNVKGVHYSFGWYQGKILGHEIFWHSGEFGGYRNLVLSIPELNFAIVALSNNASLEVEKLGLNWAEEYISRVIGQ